jgi:hypothetical protein
VSDIRIDSPKSQGVSLIRVPTNASQESMVMTGVKGASVELTQQRRGESVKCSCQLKTLSKVYHCF